MKEMKKSTYPMYGNREEVCSIRDAFDRAIKKYPHNICCRYIQKDEVISKSYIDVFYDISHIGSYLVKKCGYSDKKVAFVSETTYRWYVTYLAALYYGVVAVPLDRLLNEKDLTAQIEFADVSVVFYDSKQSTKMKIIKEKCKSIELISLEQKEEFSLCYDDIINLSTEKEKLHDIGPDDLAEIVFTSGTTGTSKGVMISQYNIASVLMFCTNLFDFNEETRIISFLPNNHLYFLSTGLIMNTYYGCTVCLNENILNFKHDMKMFQPDFVLSVPALFHLLKRDILSSVKQEGIEILKNGDSEESKLMKEKIRQSLGGKLEIVACGGAFLDQETVEFFRLFDIELVEGYGISECSPLISCSVHRRIDRNKKETVGLVGTCCDVKIVDGEVYVSGANVMLGYYKNPELTAQVMDGEWFKTGDLGYMDEDGYLYLTGRKKNLIILSNGENVCPEEVENYLYCIDEVDNAIVYDEKEMIVAEIYPNKRLLEEAKIEDAYTFFKQKVNEINKRIPSYKQIRKIVLRDTPFELTSTMKVKRQGLTMIGG